MNIENARLLFLLYDNRSGSTYLSSLLDSYEEIGVSLESPGLIYQITAHDYYRTEKEIVAFLNYIYVDPRFEEWKLSKEDLKKELIVHLPLSKKDLFHLVLNEYFRKVKPAAKCWIYKSGNPYLIRRLTKCFPGSKFIYIYRDGRAVFCSKKKSISLLNQKPMEDDPVLAARKWIAYNQIVDQFDHNDNLTKVRYENLVKAPMQEIKSIYHFIFESTASGKDLHLDSKTYYGKIPQAQLDLHPNVYKKPVVSRINAWKNELGFKDGYLYEKTARYELNKLGYASYFYDDRQLSKIGHTEMVLYKLKLLINRFMKKINKIIFFASHVNVASRKIIVRVENMFG